MGKKSRLKKERREMKALGLPESSPHSLVQLSINKSTVYRFFQEEWQAEALVNGGVWLSTLETCRTYEHPEQGDPGEAQETYYSGHITGDGDDPEFVEMARRSGVSVGPGSRNITISNCTRRSSIPDAYVLCTTLHFNPAKMNDTFGNFCVEITDPARFFIAVSNEMQKIFHIREGAAGRVIYRDRHYTGLEKPPGPIGFVKPADIYAPQKEFRMLWIPQNNAGLEPRLIDCPQVKDFCKRII